MPYLLAAAKGSIFVIELTSAYLPYVRINTS
jgi:hypothetical protein